MSIVASLPPFGTIAALTLAETVSPLVDSGWTTKEVLSCIGMVIAAVLTASFSFHRWWMMELRRSKAELKKEKEELERKLKKEKDELERKLKDKYQELEQLKQTPSSNAVAKEIDQQMAVVKQGVDALVQAIYADGEDRVATQKKLAEQLQGQLNSLQDDLGRREEELKAANRRLRKALDKDGQTWTEKVRAVAPDFKPLDPDGRRTPILSVLNLKGGVGKTTVTANLGAALAELGYRVLLIDLDLQGSLSGLYLSEAEQEQLYQQGKLLADFLDRAFDAEYPNLLEYTQPILGNKSGLVATTDTLAYAEVNLTIRWLLRDSNRDPRFLLRKELHLKRVTNNYDVVLLDCPPLINVSCVNALAASDHLLIPVLPSKQATARVPVLLKRLREFRENINGELNLLGVLANRTYRADGLTSDEANRLSGLRLECRDAWGQEVPQLDTFIQQNTDVRRAEDENRPLGKEDELYPAFEALAQEVVSRLPMFCRQPRRSSAEVEEVAS